jgi:hypothetical protein
MQQQRNTGNAALNVHGWRGTEGLTPLHVAEHGAAHIAHKTIGTMLGRQASWQSLSVPLSESG